MLGRQFVGERFCEDCEPYQSKYPIVDAWREMMEAVKVLAERGRLG
jgi:hypothetical protein